MLLNILWMSSRRIKVAAYTILAVLLLFALHWVFTDKEHTVLESSSSSASTRNSSVTLKDLSLLLNNKYDYILMDKDPCFVWRAELTIHEEGQPVHSSSHLHYSVNQPGPSKGLSINKKIVRMHFNPKTHKRTLHVTELRNVTVPAVWWQQHCELERFKYVVFFERDWMTLDYECKDMRMMGNWAVCFDYDLIPKSSCLVYSFGIDNDFRFDDAMASVGCTVYSFDPSMNVQDHKHAERVFFKNVGISGHDNDSFVPRLDIYVHAPTTWRVQRLVSIMKELGHEPGSLTVFKMDIEANEWDVLSDLLESNILPTIPQVLVEWHLFPDAPPHSRLANIFDDYFRFKALGFQKFYMPLTMDSHTIENLRTLTEIAYVNKNKLHL